MMSSAAVRVVLSQRLRIAIALFCVVVALAEGDAIAVAPGALAVVLIELLLPQRRAPRVRLVLTAAVAVLTVAASAGDTEAAMPLLLLGAFRAAESLGLRALLLERATSSVLVLGSVVVALDRSSVSLSQICALAQWLGLGLALGLLVVWNRQVKAEPSRSERAMALEAARLAGRLQRLARELPLGLDAPTVAQTLLDEAQSLLDVDVCAVLQRLDHQTASPLALRAAQRLPWRDPVRSVGALHEAWVGCMVTSDLREKDGPDGRRRGSALLCVPVLGVRRDMIALMVLERRTAVAFTAEEVLLAEHAASWVAPQLEAALHFSELQNAATLREREQLARAMHDGIAQDLVYVGFCLDRLAVTAAEQPSVARELRELRAEVSRILGDMRLSIADLRVGVRPDEGLGRTLSAMLQRFGTTAGCSVQVELHESTFRLPATVEMGLARLAHEMLVDARSGGAKSVRLVLRTDPPMGSLVVEHDGRTSWDDTRPMPALLGRDTSVEVDHPEDGSGIRLAVRVGRRLGASRPKMLGTHDRRGPAVAGGIS
jgi:signal transduction histidine kinase